MKGWHHWHGNSKGPQVFRHPALSSCESRLAASSPIYAVKSAASPNLLQCNTFVQQCNTFGGACVTTAHLWWLRKQQYNFVALAAALTRGFFGGFYWRKKYLVIWQPRSSFHHIFKICSVIGLLVLEVHNCEA